VGRNDPGRIDPGEQVIGASQVKLFLQNLQNQHTRTVKRLGFLFVPMQKCMKWLRCCISAHITSFLNDPDSIGYITYKFIIVLYCSKKFYKFKQVSNNLLYNDFIVNIYTIGLVFRQFFGNYLFISCMQKNNNSFILVYFKYLFISCKYKKNNNSFILVYFCQRSMYYFTLCLTSD
jgi:hypothetical protein